VEELPSDLSVERHALLRGRSNHPWYRRSLFGLVCLLPVIALLNAFGQVPSTSSANGAAATMEVQAPKRVRGGLLFQVRVDVVARQDVKEPQFVLSPGWWEQLTENSINPEPIDTSTSNGRVTLSYGRLNAGQKLTVWLEYQVNPANLGGQTTNILLTDGDTPIAEVKRDIYVFP
jgi:hypothetical protein